MNHVFLLELQKNYCDAENLKHEQLRGPTTWKDMLRNSLSDTVNWHKRKWSNCTKFSSPCLDDRRSKKEELESVGELSEVCSQMVSKCLYKARIGRPDILWSVNKLARSVTKWTHACDRRLARLISYIHHANDSRHYCHVGNTAQQLGLGWFVSRFKLCW